MYRRCVSESDVQSVYKAELCTECVKVSDVQSVYNGE
jgi:hypothetical protein